MAVIGTTELGRGSHRLRWGILGAANIAKGQVGPAIRSSRSAEVVAVASRDASAASRFAADLGVERSYGRYEDLILDGDVDAIYIPLPNSMHREWALKALNAGKAVLCEKPIALTRAEAAEMFAAADGAGRPLMEAFMYRFHPQNLRVIELLRSGAIGTVREVRAHLSVDILAGADGSNVRFKPALGGGAILDMGCYSVDIARLVLGAEPISVRGWRRMHRDFGVDVAAAAILEFDDAVALVSCSFEANGNGGYVVVGSRGTIEVPRGVIPGLGTRAAEGLVIMVDADGRRTEEVIEPVDQYRFMVEAFSDAILAGRPVPRSPSDSLGTMAVMDKWISSADSGAGR